MAKAAEIDGKQIKGEPKKKAQKAAKPSVWARFMGYLRGVRSEMKRVVWPTRKEVINSSFVVIVTLLFFISFTLVIDQLLMKPIIIDVLSNIGIGK